MSLIDNKLIAFRYPSEIENFLNILKEKTVRRDPSRAVFDELYGILPATRTDWKDHSPMIEQWELDGVMTLRNEWNNLKMTLLSSGAHWYCTQVGMFKNSFAVELENSFNFEKYQEIYALSASLLEFLQSGYNNLLLKNTGIRNYIFEQQEKAESVSKRDLLSEIFITLLGQKLTENEEFDQNLFTRKAELIVSHIVGERAKCCISPMVRDLAGIAAVRGQKHELLEKEFYVPISLIWGFLANEKYMAVHQQESDTPYYFLEQYYPDQTIRISSVLPATPLDKTEMMILRDHDAYKQVFPDHKTALTFHRIACGIINKIGEQK